MLRCVAVRGSVSRVAVTNRVSALLMGGVDLKSECTHREPSTCHELDHTKTDSIIQIPPTLVLSTSRLQGYLSAARAYVRLQ